MPLNKTLMHTIGTVHRGLFRLTNGAIGANLGGRPMLLLTTTGRKSGRQRTIPLQYMKDGDNAVVVASNGGNTEHPAWWRNVRANPEVTVATRGKSERMRAETAGPEERARLWPLLVDFYPGYQEYDDETEREIPVVVLRAVE